MQFIIAGILIWLLGIFIISIVWRRINPNYSWSPSADKGFDYTFGTILWPLVMILLPLFYGFSYIGKAFKWLAKGPIYIWSVLAIGKQ